MAFSPNRRFWILILFCLTIGVIYVLARHTPPPSDNTSAYILITPTVVETAGEAQTPTISITPAIAPIALVSTPVFTATVVATYSEATASDVIDPKKLRAKDVVVTVHKVDFGENYWTLAKQANIDIYTLIGANPTMPFKAAYHMTLNILSRKGVLHTVHPEDNLSKLAEEYRTTEKIIKDTNDIHWWRPMHKGDVLFIPNAKPLLMVKEWRDYFSKRGMFGVPFSKWATWTSGFGLRIDPFTGKHREHTGVDLRAKYGDPVYASAPGKVIFTGVAGGYGNLIKIAHAHGYTSYYGHLSKIYARMGAKVRRGTLIGRVGATGRVTGPHLHFEIRLNGKPLDPLQFI